MAKHTGLGQAVLEFAIFASFLLLCVGIFIQTGMYTLLSDNLRMTAFRRAVRLAQHVGATESTDYPYPSVAVIKDQFIPNPGRYFGAADTATISASYSPVVTTRMRQMPGKRAFQAHTQLPLLWLDINSTPSSQHTLIYTLGDYSSLPSRTQHLLPCTGFRVKKDVDNVEAGPPGVWWEWAGDTAQMGWCGATEPLVYARSKKSNGDYYIDANAEVWVDTDGDHVEDTPLTVMAAERTDGCPNGVCSFESIAFLDPRGGDIDSYAKTVNPATGIEEGQGLQSTYAKVRNSNNTVNRSETPSKITTTGIINNQVTVRRTIKTNPTGYYKGDTHEVDSTIRQKILENF